MNEANKILMTNINHGHRFALPMRLAVKYLCDGNFLKLLISVGDRLNLRIRNSLIFVYQL